MPSAQSEDAIAMNVWTSLVFGCFHVLEWECVEDITPRKDSEAQKDKLEFFFVLFCMFCIFVCWSRFYTFFVFKYFFYLIFLLKIIWKLLDFVSGANSNSRLPSVLSEVYPKSILTALWLLLSVPFCSKDSNTNSLSSQGRSRSVFVSEDFGCLPNGFKCVQ